MAQTHSFFLTNVVNPSVFRCLVMPQVVHPIHDRTLYNKMDHKRKLKEEFGIEPWTLNKNWVVQFLCQLVVIIINISVRPLQHVVGRSDRWLDRKPGDKWRSGQQVVETF